MVSRDLDTLATWEFEAEVLVLHHPTTISPRYQAMGMFNFISEFISSFLTLNTDLNLCALRALESVNNYYKV